MLKLLFFWTLVFVFFISSNAQERKQSWYEIYVLHKGKKEVLGCQHIIFEPHVHKKSPAFLETRRNFMSHPTEKGFFLFSTFKYVVGLDYRALAATATYSHPGSIKETLKADVLEKKAIIHRDWGGQLQSFTPEIPEEIYFFILGKMLKEEELFETGKKWVRKTLDVGKLGVVFTVEGEAIKRKPFKTPLGVFKTVMVKTLIKERIDAPTSVYFEEETGRLIARKMGDIFTILCKKPFEDEDILNAPKTAEIYAIPETFLGQNAPNYNINVPPDWNKSNLVLPPVETSFVNKTMGTVQIINYKKNTNIKDIKEQVLAKLRLQDPELLERGEREIWLGKRRALEFIVDVKMDDIIQRQINLCIATKQQGFHVVAFGNIKKQYKHYWPVWFKILHSFSPKVPRKKPTKKKEEKEND